MSENNTDIDDEFEKMEDTSLFSNEVFLAFFSAGITILVLGYAFIGYIFYYYSGQQSSAVPTTVPIPVLGNTENDKPTWKSEDIKMANKVKSGTIKVDNQLELTINSLKLTPERNWDMYEKSYPQVAIINYTFKNLGVSDGLSITADDIEIRDEKGALVDSYTLDSVASDYISLQPNEEATIEYPVAIVNASSDLTVMLKTRDGKIKSSKSLNLHLD